MRVINRELLDELDFKTETAVMCASNVHKGADDTVEFVEFQGIQYYPTDGKFCAIYKLETEVGDKDPFFLPILMNSHGGLVFVMETAVPQFVEWMNHKLAVKNNQK